MKMIFYFYYEHVIRHLVLEIEVKLDLLSNTLEVIIKKKILNMSIFLYCFIHPSIEPGFIIMLQQMRIFIKQ